MTEHRSGDAQVIQSFFDQLNGTAPQVLRGQQGTIRFDIAAPSKTEHWSATIDDCKVSVTTRNVKADVVVEADEELFAKIVTGRSNPMAAIFRGAMRIEGLSAVSLALAFQRIFPGPPDSVGPASPAAGASQRGDGAPARRHSRVR